VKWVDPENIHFTLKFIGEISGEQLSEVTGILTECCKGVKPFAITLKGVGAFPSASRPQVVWVGAQPTDAESGESLTKLVASLEEWLETIGIPREGRPFSPHLTLGRTRGPKGTDRLAKAIAEMGGRVFGEMLAEEVVLMQSTLSPNGPTYAPLQRVALT
jgi:2'-5' RNA ligase